MPDVVVPGEQTRRVSASPRGQAVVGRIVFNPVRITLPKRSVSITNEPNNVVVTEKVRIELDTARMISGETPTPSVNGAHLIFTVSAYVAGSLQVTQSGTRMYPISDYSETSPAAGTFTMVQAPASNQPLLVDYIKA